MKETDYNTDATKIRITLRSIVFHFMESKDIFPCKWFKTDVCINVYIYIYHQINYSLIH